MNRDHHPAEGAFKEDLHFRHTDEQYVRSSHANTMADMKAHVPEAEAMMSADSAVSRMLLKGYGLQHIDGFGLSHNGYRGAVML